MRFLNQITALLLTLEVSFCKGVGKIDGTTEKGQITARNNVTRKKIIFRPDLTTELEQIYAGNTTTTDNFTMHSTKEKLKSFLADEASDNYIYSKWASLQHVNNFQKYVMSALVDQTNMLNRIQRGIKNLKGKHTYAGGNAECIPPYCTEAIQKTGRSGIIKIKPPYSDVVPFHVYCLKENASGDPWTIIQRRLGGIVDFKRTWNEYKAGFGNQNGEFWLGLDKIYALTNSKKHELRIKLTNWTGDVYYANYDSFLISDEESNYTLKSLGKYSGNASDCLIRNHLGQMWSTPDMDNDQLANKNCAAQFHGGWWLRKCGFSNLNSRYPPHDVIFEVQGAGVYWRYLQLPSLHQSEMAIRIRKFEKP